MSKYILPESFYIIEPNFVDQSSPTGGNGATLDIKSALSGSSTPWRINSLQPVTSRILKKIIISYQNFFSQISDQENIVVLPLCFYEIFLENKVKEIYYLEAKTGDLISLPLHKFKFFMYGQYYLTCPSNPQVANKSQIQAQLKNLKNTGQYLILDQYEALLTRQKVSRTYNERDLHTLEYSCPNMETENVNEELIQTFLAHRLDKIREISIQNISDPKLSLSRVFDKIVTAERVVLYGCSDNLLKTLPKNIRELSLNHMSLIHSDLSILSSFKNLEKLTIYRDSELKDLNLSKTQLKSLFINDTKLLGKVELPSGCKYSFTPIRVKLEEPKIIEESAPSPKHRLNSYPQCGTDTETYTDLNEETKIIEDSKLSRKHRSNPHPQCGIDTETYTDPNKVLRSADLLILRKQGQLSQGNDHELRMLRKNFADEIVFEKNQFFLLSRNPGDLQNPATDIVEVKSFSPTDLKKMSDQQYYLSISGEFDDKGWTPLPSLNIGDKILNIACSHSLEKIKFSPEYQCYWLKLKTPIITPVKIELLAEKNPSPQFYPPTDSLEFPREAKDKLMEFIRKEEKGLPILHKFQDLLASNSESDKLKFIADLPNFFEKFSNEKLDLKTDSSYPNALKILKQQKGSCRHRSFVFVLLCRLLGLNARRCSSSIHAFVEIVQSDGKIFTYDLGGAETAGTDYPTPPDLSDDETADTDYPALSDWPESAQISQVLFSPYLHFPDLKDDKDLLTRITQTSKLFVPVTNQAEARGMYQAIYTQAGDRPVFYAESYAQLLQGLQGFKLSEEKSEPVAGPLTQVLAEGGILVINCQRFTENELLQCASLLDTPPSFEKQVINTKLSVINLISFAKVTACHAFNRRAKHLYWPEDIKKPQFSLPNRSAATDLKIEQKPLHLFNNSRTWESTLFGSPQLSSTGLTFKPGELVKARDTSVAIIDPPVNDEYFQYHATLLSVTKRFEANGQFIAVAPEFNWSWYAAADLKIPPNLTLLTPKETYLAQIIQTGADIVYINHSNLNQLNQASLFDSTSKNFKDVPSWLEQTNSKTKVIAVTEALYKSEYNQLYYQVSQFPDQQFQLLDLSLAPANTVPLLTEFKHDIPGGAHIFETQDPDFTAQSWLTDSKMSLRCIDLHTQANLFETLDYKRKTTSMTLEFFHQLSALTQDLLDGKTVVLKGPLSPTTYVAMQYLFSEPGYLKLYHQSEPIPIKGRLIIVTPPLNYPVLVAQQTSRYHSVCPDLLWKQYQTKAKAEFKFYNKENFVKIKKLSQVITSLIQDKQVSVPEVTAFNFSQITRMLKILSEEKYARENPIKSVFLEGYDKSSEIYAQINVVCKLLFSQNITPGVRRAKLAQFTASHSNLWKQLNCLHGASLKEVLKTDVENFDPEQFLKLDPAIFIKQLRSRPDQNIPKNDRHREKIIARVKADLDQAHAVLLLGPPGSGKTTLANTIAHEQGQVFSGISQLQAWRSCKPGPCKKATLIIDEANSSLHKADLDLLIDIVANQDSHQQIIFIGNPFSYTGRSYHPLWNKVPVESLCQWSDKDLKEKIIVPLCRSLLGSESKKFSEASANFDKLLTIFHWIVHKTSIDRVGNRNLEQLTKRWFDYLRKFPATSAPQALFAATKIEFLDLPAIGDKNTFLSVLSSICNPRNEFDSSHSGCDDLKSFQQHVLNHLSDTFLLSESRVQIMQRLYEYLQFKQTFPEAKAGILLEGASGQGKSRLACELFKCMGYHKFENPQEILDSDVIDMSKTYIEVTLTKQLIQDPAWLLKAFNLGCKVVLNESNSQISFPLLNHLLTGVTPDNEPPKVLGFCLIATQNPVEDGGRFDLTEDLMNRFHVIGVPEDTAQDFLEIANHALPHKAQLERQALVKKFIKQKQLTPHLTTSAHFFNAVLKLRDEKSQEKINPYRSPSLTIQNKN